MAANYNRENKSCTIIGKIITINIYLACFQTKFSYHLHFDKVRPRLFLGYQENDYFQLYV